MIVYHGSDEIVEKPDVLHSFRPLDFGKGFYVTSNKDQARKWALRKADLNRKPKAYINVYEMKENIYDLIIKTFPDSLEEWIDFVCNCRDGNDDYLKYDVIKGKVADDKVFRVVDMYHLHIWDKQRALLEIRAYDTYDQIAFITQRSIDSLLEFKSAEEV